MVRRGGSITAGLMFVLLLSVPALAHGQLEGSDPEDGAKLNSPPAQVSIDMTETPSNADQFEVLDGCGRDVIDKAQVKDKSLVATIQDTAQPGAWLADWRIVSAEDGHVTDGSIDFRVNGSPDCSAKTKPTAPQATPEDSSSSISPVVIVLGVVGLLVVIGLALLVRRTS